MENLRVTGVEDGAILVVSESGEKYRIEITDAVTAQMRQAVKDPGTARRLAPKDIQAHIRSGMSAEDVAAITGVAVEYIQRFEGPILAEREFVIESALAVPVHTAKDTEFGDSQATFGSAILARLNELSATGERWASWKEETSGWVVKLSFAAGEVDHDARWRFDPKKSSLAPLNNEAEALSRQGELTGTLIPRLRAVDGGERMPDTTRFDSGAFVDSELVDSELVDSELVELRTRPSIGLVHTPHDDAELDSGTSFQDTSFQDTSFQDTSLQDTAPHLEAVPFGRSNERVRDPAPSNQTADLLDALRRRRGERESANFEDLDDAMPQHMAEHMADHMAEHPSTGSIRLVSVPLPDSEDGSGGDESGQAAPRPVSAKPRAAKPTKRGRASVPSWDEIVFGARSDDDPA